jgi:primase-polymerase (primpol)-like protein
MLDRNDLLKMAENFPDSLKERKIWLGFILKQRDNSEKFDKIPVDIDAALLGEIRCVNAAKKEYHYSFNDAYTALKMGMIEGLGISLIDSDLCVIDIDDAVEKENDTYQYNDDVRYMLNRFDSFSEVSVSEKGIHIFLIGRKTQNVLKYTYKSIEGEIYDGGDRRSFIAVTGCVIHNGGIENRQDVIDRFCKGIASQSNSLKKEERESSQVIKEKREWIPSNRPQPTKEQLQNRCNESAWHYGLTHEEILQIIWRKEKIDDNFKRFQGRLDEIETPDGKDIPFVHDFRLARCFAFHTRDYNLTLQLMYLSELWRPKWEKHSGNDEDGGRKSYIEVTVYFALGEILAQYGETLPNYKRNVTPKYNVSTPSTGKVLWERRKI